MNISLTPHQSFESIKKINSERGEYWSARDLAAVLQYSEYRHFLPVIEKAKISCLNSGHPIQNHFEEILEEYLQWRLQFLDESGQLLPKYRPGAMEQNFIDQEYSNQPSASSRSHIPVPSGPQEWW